MSKYIFFCTRTELYSRVCGQLLGYQLGTPNAFYSYFLNSSLTVDDVYVDGASITYGSTLRRHIWTYINGLNLVYPGVPSTVCPCNNSIANSIPSYVGSDYYCETGNNQNCCDYMYGLFSNDTLWDGRQCPSEEAPCCAHSNMPWFNKTLSETTTEDIELRVCGDSPVTNEDTPLQVIEIFLR